MTKVSGVSSPEPLREEEIALVSTARPSAPHSTGISTACQ